MLYLIGHVDTVAAWDIEEYAAVEEWRKVSSSRAGFVVPDRCEALIDLHLSPSVNPGEVRRELEALRLTALQ